mmetsp:Transcript_29450/g.83058  ORF Transcript_29450/g.83058 Transcript_29450/m.83058 type:complete len:259 (+) Transcript_29450:242-1018(+)
MITNHRPSILRRPLKPPTKNNVESRESEFQQQQDYWEAKSQKSRETEDRLHRSIYPDEDSKKRDQEVVKQVMERQLQEVREKRAMEAVSKANSWVQDEITTDHPWAHKTEDRMQRQIADIRRKLAREAAEENRQLVISRRQEQLAVEEEEKARVRRAADNEETWWNHGAASDRWLPPERRIKPGRVAAAYREQHETGNPYSWQEPAAAVPQATSQPPPRSRPPFIWETEDEQSVGLNQQKSSPRAPLPARVYPWSWEQ